MHALSFVLLLCTCFSISLLVVVHYSHTVIYIQQNNLRATSFIFPVIITKMRPSNFKIISWPKLEVSALFQSAQRVCNVLGYKRVNGTNNARPKGSKKNGNFQKTIFFYTKMNFLSEYRKISFFNGNNTLSQQIMQTQPSFE